MSPDKIRAMDGLALSKLALTLGLAPEGTQLWDDEPYDFSAREPWEPHRRITQADACLRGLRTRGWATTIQWFQPGRGAGIVYAVRQAGHQEEQRVRCRFGANGEDTETEALLLASVLAVMSETTP